MLPMPPISTDLKLTNDQRVKPPIARLGMTGTGSFGSTCLFAATVTMTTTLPVSKKNKKNKKTVVHRFYVVPVSS